MPSRTAEGGRSHEDREASHEDLHPLYGILLGDERQLANPIGNHGSEERSEVRED